MTSVRKLLGVLFLGLLFTASAALASDIVQFKLTGASGYTLPQTDQQVYPYTALINGVDVVTVACDDYYHDVGIGYSWQAYRTYLSLGDVSNTRFGNTPDGLTLYKELGYLANKLAVAPTQFERAEINWAMWELTSNAINQPLTYGFDAGIQSDIQAFVNDAQANYNNGPVPEWMDIVIYTPVDSSGQETIEVVTPEPGTMLLLGSSIVGLWSQRKRIL